MLNKHGWGLKEMLILSGILILFLFVAIFYIFTLYNELDKEISSNYYSSLEHDLEASAEIYLNDYFDGVLTDEKITISRNVLRLYDLDVTLKDKNGNLCSGYVVANKDAIKGYISCDEYTTEGYEEWRK